MDTNIPDEVESTEKSPLLANGKVPDKDDEGPSVEVQKINRMVTVEPIVVLYFTAFMANTPITQQYIYGQIGMKYNLTDGGIPTGETCGLNMSQHEVDLHNKVQSETSTWLQINTVISVFPLLFSTLLLGSYSDKAGRRVGIILPLIGAIVATTGCAIVAALRLPFWYIFVGNFASGLSGGPTTMLTACYSYIADVTTHDQRSKSMVIINICEGIGTVVVQLGMGFIIQYIGFAYDYAILVGFYSICTVYAIFFLPETLKKTTKTIAISKDHFLKPLKLYCKDNGTKRLRRIQILTLIIIAFTMVDFGVSSVTTLFLYAAPLCFGPIQLGAYNAFMCFTGTIGILLIMWCCMRLQDEGLMILGSVSQIAFLVILAFSKNIFLVFAAVTVGAPNGLVIPLGRSALSKLVDQREQGALFAAISWLMLVAVLFGSLIFINVYNATLSIMPGFSFLIATAITLIVTLLCIFTLRYERLPPDSTRTSAEDDDYRRESVPT